MNLKKLREKIHARVWKFQHGTKIGRWWNKLNAEEKFMFWLVGIQVSIMSLIFILDSLK